MPSPNDKLALDDLFAPGSGSGGIISINGDTTPAQLIEAGTGISVVTAGGTTTITNTGGGSLPTLAQNHFYVGNASSLPVDAGTHLTYTGTAYHVDFIGISALELSTDPTAKTTRFGFNTGTPGTEDTLIGYGAGNGGSGDLWTVIGSNAGGGTSSGARLTAVGRDAGSNSTGDFVDAFGSSAGRGNTGSNISLFGHASGFNNSGSNVFGFGYNTVNSNSGSDVIALGWQSGFLNSFSNVIIMGHQPAPTADNQFIVGGGTGSGFEIPNWQINGIDYVMPSGAYVTGGALTDVAGDGTLSWVVPSGGGGITYGGAVTTSHNSEVLYINPSGNLASDSNFTRDSGTNFNTYIAATDGGSSTSFVQINDNSVLLSTTVGAGQVTQITTTPTYSLLIIIDATTSHTSGITANYDGSDTQLILENRNISWLWPTADAAGVLNSDGSGNLSFGSLAPSSITGTLTQIPYFDATTGMMTSDANFFRDNSNNFQTGITATDGSDATGLTINSNSLALNTTLGTGGQASFNFSPVGTDIYLSLGSGTTGVFNATANYNPTGITQIFADAVSGISSSLTMDVTQNLNRLNDASGPNTFSASTELTNMSVTSLYFDVASGISSSNALDVTQNKSLIGDGSTFNTSSILTSTNAVTIFQDLVGGNTATSTLDGSTNKMELTDASTFSGQVALSASSSILQYVFLTGSTDLTLTPTQTQLVWSNASASAQTIYNDTNGIVTSFTNIGTTNITSLAIGDLTYTLNQLGGNGAGFVAVDNTGLLSWSAGATAAPNLLQSHIGYGDGSNLLDGTGSGDFVYDVSASIFHAEFTGGNGSFIDLNDANGSFNIIGTDGATYSGSISAGSLGATLDYSDFAGNSTDVEVSNGAVVIGQTSGGNSTQIVLTDAAQSIAFKGGVFYNYVAVTGAYSILPSDYTIDSNGTFTNTLPDATLNEGQIYIIKNSGVGVITLATTAGQTIDGSPTATITTSQSLQVQSTGGNYIIIN